MLNRLLFIVPFIFITVSQLSAQQYTYVYDAAGNRTAVTLLKSSPANMDTALVQKPVTLTEQGQEFKLYPNPTKGQVTIECSGLPENTKVTCTIHDMNGKFISNADYHTQQTIKCDLNTLPNGLYILQIKLSGNQHVLKVLKE